MRNRLFPVALLSVLSLLALALTFINLRQALPLAQWQQAMFAPDIDNIRQVVFHYSLLSRLALLVGAGLGLAGLLFQQVLRNPLAEPTTLGVSSGAQLGLTVATLWQLPGGELTQQFAAMGGAVLVGVLVFGIAWGKRLSPVTLILAGLVLSLYAGAVNQIFAIFNHDQLQNMFLWSTGALNQLDGHNVALLWPRLLLAFALALAILLSAQLVNVAGIIGFIGLFASLLAKMLGARRLLSRLLLAPLIGALLLWLADQCVLWLTAHWREVSTGTATALIGVPILLWLLPRLRTGSLPPAMNAGDTVSQERQAVLRWCLAGVMILALCSLAGIAFGRDAHGWTWVSGDMLQQLLPWRVPRVLAALVVGMMLGVAGVLIQRLTVNPMASPEVLGISSGAACGGVVMLFLCARQRGRLAAACGRAGRRADAAGDYAGGQPWRFCAGTHAAGRNGAEQCVRHVTDGVAGERRSAHGRAAELDFRFDVQHLNDAGAAERCRGHDTGGAGTAGQPLADAAAARWWPAGVRRLVRPHAGLPGSNPGGPDGDLLRRAVFYLAAKARLVKRGAINCAPAGLQLREAAAGGIDGALNIFLAVRQ